MSTASTRSATSTCSSTRTTWPRPRSCSWWTRWSPPSTPPANRSTGPPPGSCGSSSAPSWAWPRCCSSGRSNPRSEPADLIARLAVDDPVDVAHAVVVAPRRSGEPEDPGALELGQMDCSPARVEGEHPCPLGAEAGAARQGDLSPDVGPEQLQPAPLVPEVRRMAEKYRHRGQGTEDHQTERFGSG